MREQGYGHGTEPLTAVERARLRPSVNADALEHLIAATRGEFRRGLVAHFSQAATRDDVRVGLCEMGQEAFWRDIEADHARAEHVEASFPPGTPPSRLARGATDDGAAIEWSLVGAPQWVISMQPPSDPALRALWLAVEPSGPQAG